MNYGAGALCQCHRSLTLRLKSGCDFWGAQAPWDNPHAILYGTFQPFPKPEKNFDLTDGMAEATPEPHAAEWELSKENFAPVRSGRAKAVLCEIPDAADSSSKQALETKRRSVTAFLPFFLATVTHVL